MSVRNILQEYTLVTTLTVPITFSGPFPSPITVNCYLCKDRKISNCDNSRCYWSYYNFNNYIIFSNSRNYVFRYPNDTSIYSC